MIQAIAAVVVAIWFFRSARAVGRSGIGWAIRGVLSFIAPSLLWMVFAGAVIFPAVMNADLDDAEAIFLGLGIGPGTPHVGKLPP